MRDAFSNTLVRAALSDSRIVLLTGDHGYALFDAFRKACPERFINCGIAEQNMVGVAAGLAKGGFKPVVYGLAAFTPMRVLEQIKIDICYENLPVILIGDGAGLVYSHLGTSHQCTEDIACARSIPALTVLSPADRSEMTAAMEYAVRLGTPVYLRMGKSDCGDVHSGPVQMNTGGLLKVRGGAQRIAILATGSMVKTAIGLTNLGLDADVWSVPIIKPLYTECLRKIVDHVECIVVLEEHSVMGGLGSYVAEEISEYRPIPVCRIGVDDRFSAYCGTWDYLLHEHRLDLKSVHRRIENFMRQLHAN